MDGSRTPDYGFLRRPWWLAGIVVGLVAIGVFVLLGIWQLGRLESRRSFNELLTSRLEAPAMDIDQLAARAGAEPDAVRYRRTTATGVYEAESEVLLAGRSYLGQSGYHVLTPLVLGDGRAVLVDRGWVPLDVSGPPAVEYPPPTGTVTVVGIADTGPGGRNFGSPGTDGRVARVGAIDLEQLDDQIAASLHPLYLTLEGSTGAAASSPVPSGPTVLGDGPHLGYAGQWFLFAAVVAVGFPILVYRTARVRPGRRERPGQAPGRA